MSDRQTDSRLNQFYDDDVEPNVLGCRADILGTNCDQCVHVHGSVLLYVHRNHEAL